MQENPFYSRLQAKATESGFDVLGITTPHIPDLNRQAFARFCQAEYYGEMEWLAGRTEERTDPEKLWPEVRSIIVLGMNYGPLDNPLPALENRQNGVISVYARGGDYHQLVKKRLKNIARWLVTETGCQLKVFVDTAPVMEKPLAQMAGIGWQGKHTNLVSREFGSWLFLGAIYTDMEMTPDVTEKDHCGNCNRCMNICPTQAITAPYQLDARRCIAYLTIEHRGHIERRFRQSIGNRIFGCDDCLAVCPWNKFARQATETRFEVLKGADQPLLTELLQLDEKGFRRLYAGSPVKRVGYAGFIRNVLIAAGNSCSLKQPAESGLVKQVYERLSESDSIIRLPAVWAYKQLVSPGRFKQVKEQYFPLEEDTEVIEEWKVNPE